MQLYEKKRRAGGRGCPVHYAATLRCKGTERGRERERERAAAAAAAAAAAYVQSGTRPPVNESAGHKARNVH